MTATIRKMGAYDLPTETYMADPVVGGSLSNSALRWILPPGSPLHFRHHRGRVSPPTDAQRFGTLVHHQILGVGDELEVVAAASWQGKAAKAAFDEAVARGATPVLEKDLVKARAMAEAWRADPEAGPLLDPSTGRVEVTIVWDDELTGEPCRGLIDFLRFPDSDGIVYVIDYKTTRSIDPDALARTIANFDYHRQGAWYRAGVRRLIELGLLPEAREVRFLLAFQEHGDDSPFAPLIVEPDETALMWGEEINARAVREYLACVEADAWPGPSRNGWVRLGLPVWERRRLEDLADAGYFAGDATPDPDPETPEEWITR